MNKKTQTAILAIAAMKPEEMAQASALVQNAHAYILEKIDEITDGAVRDKLRGLCASPDDSCLPAGRPGRERLYRSLREAGYLPEKVSFADFLPAPGSAPIPLQAGPGSSRDSHHAHPGGLALHTAENLKLSLSLAKIHKKLLGTATDKDMLIFAQAAHDLAKCWLFPCGEDGSYPGKYNIAGNGAHHVFGLAASIRQGLPPEFVVAQAATHVSPGDPGAAEIIGGFLRAACFIVEISPAAYGFFDKSGRPDFDPLRLEHCFSYMGDHTDVFSVRQYRLAAGALRNLAEKEYGLSSAELQGKIFNQLRNYVFCFLGPAKVFQLAGQGGGALSGKIGTLLSAVGGH
ncbi:MAG: hypothetical protein LBO03_05110 [Acidaminococcales bacterium]|jgi:hypothetical protein|nr:hypothetical protein [Acidaminococcales bacterium]